jgi:hypothetical protein
MANFVTGTKGTNRDIVPPCPPGHEGDKSGHPPLGGVPLSLSPSPTADPRFEFRAIACVVAAPEKNRGSCQDPLPPLPWGTPDSSRESLLRGGGATAYAIPSNCRRKPRAPRILWKHCLSRAVGFLTFIANPRIPSRPRASDPPLQPQEKVS